MAAATLPNVSADLIWEIVREFYNPTNVEF